MQSSRSPEPVSAGDKNPPMLAQLAQSGTQIGASVSFSHII
jgi:hypothetical protein